MKDRIAQLLQEFRAGLERIYSFRLHGIYLCGSYARREADAESDADILVVLEDFAHYGSEVDRMGQLGRSCPSNMESV